MGRGRRCACVFCLEKTSHIKNINPKHNDGSRPRVESNQLRSVIEEPTGKSELTTGVGGTVGGRAAPVSGATVTPVPRLTAGKASPISSAPSPLSRVSPRPRAPSVFIPQHCFVRRGRRRKQKDRQTGRMQDRGGGSAGGASGVHFIISPSHHLTSFCVRSEKAKQSGLCGACASATQTTHDSRVREVHAPAGQLCRGTTDYLVRCGTRASEARLLR